MKYKNPIIISKWFDCIQAITAQYNILLEDTFNFNETGCIIGVIATIKVVIGILIHHTVYIQPENKK